jgi:hypothetical protein
VTAQGGTTRRADDVLARRLPERLVLLHPASGRYYTLDEVGARIWELADGSRTSDEIAEELAREYDAPRDTIRADVAELLGELRGERLAVDAVGAP